MLEKKVTRRWLLKGSLATAAASTAAKMQPAALSAEQFIRKELAAYLATTHHEHAIKYIEPFMENIVKYGSGFEAWLQTYGTRYVTMQFDMFVDSIHYWGLNPAELQVFFRAFPLR